MNSDRSWMYRRKQNGYLHPEFLQGVDVFVHFATSQREFMNGAKIKCPCNLSRCQNKKFLDVETVRLHLSTKGFVPNYEVWVFHGETNRETRKRTRNFEEGGSSGRRVEESLRGLYNDMVMDAAGPELNLNAEEPPNPDSQKFYDMLEAENEPLWAGCTKHTKLSLVARLMNLKAEHRMSERLYDQIAELMKEIVPEDNLVTDNFYSSKKLLRGMGLPAEKIDCCPNGCMIYWGDDAEKITCKICNHARYKKNRSGNKKEKTKEAYKKMYYFPLTPRLKRLYASNATTGDMTWHADHDSKPGEMHHPSDAKAWKHFSHTHPDFAAEKRNIRLGLSADGFQPFGQFGKQYSSWPVVLTPYNLPLGMCMKEEYMFLTVLVPGPHNPKDKLDVYLQPLIAELKLLWEVGAPCYDISRKQNFQMRAALMWTVSDFPAYAMLSGWGTAGRLACPHCMEESDAFTLRCSGKQSWFDNHRKFLPPNHPFRKNKANFKKNEIVTNIARETRQGSELLNEIEELGLKKVTEVDAYDTNKEISKSCGWKKRSIFWDLPYWSSNLIRHNLDVMHVEKNVFENVFNTVMNVPKKTKDTAKSREELNDYCRRPELKKNSVGKYPPACYALDKKEKLLLCDWVKNLKLPDGYASNLGRCVDMQKGKLFGMKSHDCHVFMQRLIPIAFRELLPQTVWKALTELSLFFKDLSARVIKITDMERLEKDIPVILCKLERMFPPSFFDSMEHLPVHLPYEAKIAGPVQYRWMYPFERYLRNLKNKVTNKARVEGSISNAYLTEEGASFCSYYFEDYVKTKSRNLARNEDMRSDSENDQEDVISIFMKSGRKFGKEKKRYLNDKEYEAARSYVLLNCVEVNKYVGIYTEHLRELQPTISNNEIDKKIGVEFPRWFQEYVENPSNNVFDEYIKALAYGPFRSVITYPSYMVNGYRFHTLGHGSARATMNSGVCIRGVNSAADERDFYGRLMEVVRLEYPGYPLKTTVLFNCEWFDTSSRGTKIHPQYNLVDINHKRRLNRFEPFILATQAEQVSYCSYPGVNKKMCDWWAVLKIKPRSSVTFIPFYEPPSFQEETVQPSNLIEVDDVQANLEDPTRDAIELQYELSDTDDEFELPTDDEIDNFYQEDSEDDGIV